MGYPCGADAAIHLKALSLESCVAFNATPASMHLLSRVFQNDGFVGTLLLTTEGFGEFDCCIVRIYEPQGLNGDRRPKGCARKVVPSSTTPHEEANTMPVFTTPIPGIASRMSVLVRPTDSLVL